MEPLHYETLIIEHISYAEAIARKFYREHQHDLLEFEDVRSAAYIGLCAAAKRFQAKRGVTFKAYSYMRIRGAMYDMLRNDASPFSSRRTVEAARASDDSSRHSEDAATAVPSLSTTISRIIEELGICYERPTSESEGHLTYLSNATPEDSSAQSSLRELMTQYLAALSDKEREVVKRKYYDDLSFAEIAPHLNDVRTSWLSRIHTRALDRLRMMMPDDTAAVWLENAA